MTKILFLVFKKSTALYLFSIKECGSSGMFTLPQLTMSLVLSSNTILLSLGERPVLSPLEQLRAPVSVIVVSCTVGSQLFWCSGLKAYSYSSPTVGLWTIYILSWKPSFRRFSRHSLDAVPNYRLIMLLLLLSMSF